MAVTQKPRVRGSKNKKKAWNKCDISEVEEYLEEKRLDERIGGAPAEKTDAELFVVQTTTEDIPEVAQKIKPLKCHSNIGIYSKAEIPIIIDRERYSKGIKLSRENADKRRAKRRKIQPQNVDVTDKKDVFVADFFVSEVKDLWGEEEKIDPEIKDLVQFRDEMTRKRTPKIPSHRYQKPSLLPAVEVPHPGASYNPDFEDHQELLTEALEIELKKEREELHLKRVLTDMFPTKDKAPTAESILMEMSQGLYDEGDSEGEKETDKSISRHRNPPTTSFDRIPKSRKRRKKERKEQERLKKIDQLRKKQLNEVYRIRSLKSEIKKEEEVSHDRQDKRIQRKIDRMYHPVTLSKHKYEAPDLEITLSEELCESLRTLKAEGNLLEDRYKSLQRRNMIEPRVIQKRKRKYKLKKQVKRSHRNFE